MDKIKILIITAIILLIAFGVTYHFGWWTPADDGGAYQTMRGWFTR